MNTCPNCGYCPTCGRHNPYIPQPPYQPSVLPVYPWGSPIITCDASKIGIGTTNVVENGGGGEAPNSVS